MSSSAIERPVSVSVRHANAVIAAGLTVVLRKQADVRVCAHADQDIDLAICDYATGLELSRSRRRVTAEDNALKVLILTERDGAHPVREAMQQGVRGYLLHGAGIEELIAAVHAVAQGRGYLSALAAQRVSESEACEPLTPRESQVLQLLAAGHCNKSIGSSLGISAGTATTHVRAILSKLKAQNRIQALRSAAQWGLVVPGKRE